MTHHLAICFASRRNQRQTFHGHMIMLVPSEKRDPKGISPISNKVRNRSLRICTRFDMVDFCKVSWPYFFYFLHFIHVSTIGFSTKNEWLITGKKKVNFSCMSASYAVYPDLSNRTVRQSNPIKHQSVDCRTHSNIIELTIKFCQSNTIERSITERLVIEPNRTYKLANSILTGHSRTVTSYSYKFLAYYVDFDLKKKLFY